MPPKKKKLRLIEVKVEQNEEKPVLKDAFFIDPSVRKNLQLLYVCGFCEQILDDDVEEQLRHVESHEMDTNHCKTCCIPVKHDEQSKHLEQFHPDYPGHVKFGLTTMLIELKIPLEKCYSNFWGLVAKENSNFFRRYTTLVRKCFERHQSGRYLGIFRWSGDSKPIWNCPICENNPAYYFKETIGLRAFVLNHYEQCHREIVERTVPGFLDFEWHQLSEETDFDIKSLMNIANQRVKIKERGFKTFYTLNLARLTNGSHLQKELVKRMGGFVPEARFCLVCCSLTDAEFLKLHFQRKGHEHLKAVAHSTAFSYLSKDDLEEELNEYQISQDQNDQNSQEVKEKEERAFRFPEDLFKYTSEFKNAKTDEYKWRCCLCPRAHATTFTTPIIMRMYALRHIDEHHQFLFTDEFLEFEWQSLRQEMKAAFDLRGYNPQKYTIRGEDTFNKTDANDYVLPQQYFFLPRHSLHSTLICGFCYRSLDRKEFQQHVALHGFGSGRRKSDCDLKEVVIDDRVQELMGRERFDEAELDDEPHNVLTIQGKRLKGKMELLRERSCSQMGYSDVTTPMKSDGEGVHTPSSRKSAIDARRVLSEVFKVLQENIHKIKNAENESGCSSPSSSSDESSGDEPFEKTIEETSNSMKKLQRKSARMKTFRRSSKSPKKSFEKMNPKQIREMIRKKAAEKGVELKSSSSSDTDSDDSEEEDAGTSTGEKNKFDTMKLQDIKKLIKEAAKKRHIEMRSSSSDSE